jgi:hypothetical protein
VGKAVHENHNFPRDLRQRPLPTRAPEVGSLGQSRAGTAPVHAVCHTTVQGGTRLLACADTMILFERRRDHVLRGKES